MLSYIMRVFCRTDHEHEQRILLHKPGRWVPLHPSLSVPSSPKEGISGLLGAEDGFGLRGDISRGLLCPWSSCASGIRSCQTGSAALFEPAGCITEPSPLILHPPFLPKQKTLQIFRVKTDKTFIYSQAH